jgi:drug/metabolite transporter (DMT)-like permease
MAWALIQLAMAMVLVGANVVVGKELAAALPVPLILFLRCGLATILLAPWAMRAGAWPARGLALNLAVQAAVGTVGYNTALLAGLRLTGALEAGLVLATLPAVMAVGAAVVLGERLSGRRWAAVVLATGGMAALTLGRGGGAGGTLAGDLLVFAAVCCEASYMLLSKRSANRIGVYAGAFWMQAFGTVLLAPLALGDVARMAAVVATPWIGGLLVFHSLTASVFAIVLWYGGMRRAPANLAGVFTILLPTSAAALAVLVLGERMTIALAVGFGLMFASILVATWPRRRALDILPGG